MSQESSPENGTRRRPLVAANWKMHLLRADAAAFCDDLRENLYGETDGRVRPQVLIFPSHPLLDTVARGIEGLDADQGTEVELGGQDVHHRSEGAFTGDVSAPQLLDAGCTWALCGHSERRRDHGESDELVAKKARKALDHGLKPLVCLGERAEERKAGRTFDVLARQLDAILEEVSDPLDGGADGEAELFALAYEPVWAIGTGETATPELAQEAHAFLRRHLAERLGDATAAAIRILYGGSAKPHNVAELIAGRDVDGFLVGGASLDSKSFRAIIQGSAAD